MTGISGTQGRGRTLMSKSAEGMMRVVRRVSPYRIYALSLGATVALDKASKGLVESTLPVQPKIHVSPDFDPSTLPLVINLHHVTPPQEAYEHMGMALAYMFMTAVLIRRTNLAGDRLYQASLGVLGAAVVGGTLLDHIVQRFTVDFIHIPGTLLYTNFADVLGVVSLPFFLWRLVANRGSRI